MVQVGHLIKFVFMNRLTALLKKSVFIFLVSTGILIHYSFIGSPELSFALLKYNGGGDWYNDVNSLHNLADYCNKTLGTNINKEYVTVEPGSPGLFNQPITYMTGHGNVVFSDAEAANLRKYLIGGGFLIINDDYGMDPYIRKEMKKVFPELTFREIPGNHPIYSNEFPFPNGIPKIHEHDGKPAQAFGLFWDNRLVAFYDFEADLGDGWDDVHGDPYDLRLKALKMGVNLVKYAFTH